MPVQPVKLLVATLASLALSAVALADTPAGGPTAPDATGPILLQGDQPISPAEPPSPPPNSAVVQVGNMDFPFCTGFFINDPALNFPAGLSGRPQDIVVTAGHCAAKDVPANPDGTLEILPQGETGTLKQDLLNVAIGIDSDPAQGFDDFAILKILNGIPPDWKGVELDCATDPLTLPVGTKLTTEGFPGALPGGVVYSEGYVNGPARPLFGPMGWEQPVIPVTMPVAGGHSGSPVFLNGKVIGIAVGTIPDQTDWSIVQPITPVCLALHLTAKLAPAGAPAA